MSIKKVKLKTEVFKRNAEESGLDENVIQKIIKELNNKILEIDTNKTFVLYSTDKKLYEFYNKNIKIYNVMGWAISKSELEFIGESEEMMEEIMSDNEKILLLQLILKDIRNNWKFDLEKRVELALKLANDLKLESFINSITEYQDNCKHGDNDGRYFRESYEDGGYEEMEKLHGLKPTILDKSNEFKSFVGFFTYPECRFDDWDKFKKEVKNNE